MMAITQNPKSLCQFVKNNGRRCRARPVKGASFCFFHDPNKSVERQAAQRLEAQNKMAVLPSTTPDAPLNNMKDLIRLMGKAANQVLRGELDPKVANAFGYLCGLLMKAYHESEIELRLAALEAALKPRDMPEFLLDEDLEHSQEEAGNGKKNGQN